MFSSSQKAQIAHSLRLQVAMSEAERQARAQRITDLRERKRATQPEVADFVGVSLRAYQRWEAGGGIDRDNLEKLGEFYGVDWRLIDRGDDLETPDLMAAFSPTAALSAAVAELDQKVSKLLAGQTELRAEIGKVRTLQEAQQRSRAPAKRKKATNDK